MKRFTGWRSSAAEDDGQQASPPEHSPTRSQLSNNSTSSRGASSSLRSAYTAPKSREQSPARFGAASADTLGAATSSSGGAVVAVSSKKMLKIGANVRFRGDVMECNTVVLCGRLQGFVETQRMTIREGGMFIGDAKVEEADVYGSLDGSLESTAKVSIRSTGSVSGNVIYKKMTMEDGGELEGTFECSNRAGGRLRNREGSATGGTGGLRRGRRDDSGALAVRDNQNTLSPPGKQSPILWQNGQGAAHAGGAAAAAAAAGEEAWAGGGRVGAALEGAGVGGGTGASGSGSGSVMSSVARLESSPRGNPVTPGGTAAATTPVGVGTGGGALRRITPTGAGLSTAVRAPSPLRSTRGLQVQGLGAEAGELFSEEAVTPVGESGAGVTDLPSARSRRSSATVGGGGGGGGGGDGSAEEEGTSGGGGTSVAARVGTWPPPSPVPSSTRLWQKRTENHTTPAPAPSPAPPSTTAAPPAQTSGSITQNTVKSLVESYKPPHLQGTTTASQRQQQEQPGSGSAASRTLVSPSVVDLAGSGPVGNGDNVTGGGAGVGRMGIAAEEKLDNYESALEEESDSDSASKISGPVKACEVDGCTLEACWGDPRFRPRYCARHKKQGNKLMSPVEAEEGDKSAASPEASPEASPPMEPLPSPAKPLTDLKLGARGLPSVQPVEPPNGSGGGGGGHSTESDGLESDEDEDEGWDSGGGAAVVAAVGGRLVGAANGGSNLGGTSGGSGGGFSGGGGRGGGGGGGFGVQPALPVVQAELVGNDDDHRHHNPPEGYDEPEPVGYGGYGAAGGGGGGGGAADAEAEDAEDVQARVAAYTRLAGKKQPQATAHVPSLPKPKAQKPKKRASATNIADFYGGGESDDDEEETTGFNMDAFNKGVLLNQAAEVGTHTEDGQLRPQASSERDQQKLAHLVRVGKLGAALRGKGVTSGKRR